MLTSSSNSCFLTYDVGVGIGAIRASDAEGDLETSYVAFENADPGALTKKHQAIILVDNSTAGAAAQRARTLPQVRSAVNRLAASLEATLGSSLEMSLYAYGVDTRQITEFSSAAAPIREALGDLDFSESQTRTSAALNVAINKLLERDGIAKSIFLITDGELEDGDTLDQVVSSAQDNKIVISTFLSFWRPEGATARGGVQSLFELGVVERTGGIIGSGDLQTPRETYGSAFAGAASRHELYGGIITIPNVRSASALIEVDLTPIGGQTVTVSDRLGEDPPAAGADGDVVAEEPAAGGSIVDAPWFLPAALGVGAIALIALLLLVFRRKKPASEEEVSDYPMVGEPDDPEVGAEDPGGDDGDDGLTVPGPSVGPLLAKLELIATGAIMEVRDRKFSIGRSDKNEVVLKDDSISRIHCEFHLTREGQFAVTDLQSLNKTRVNGEEIKTQTLNDGDLIKLGEVELRFLKADA